MEYLIISSVSLQCKDNTHPIREVFVGKAADGRRSVKPTIRTIEQFALWICAVRSSKREQTNIIRVISRPQRHRNENRCEHNKAHEAGPFPEHFHFRSRILSQSLRHTICWTS